MRFNPPPGWPVEPGWTPPQDWTPDPAWPPAPAGWQFWIDDEVPAGRRRMSRGVVIALGACVVALIAAIAFVVGVRVTEKDDNTNASAKPSTNESALSPPQAIRVSSANLVKDGGSGQPKVVLSVYQDFLCPRCGEFEQALGPTIAQLIDTGAVAVDYYMMSILDREAQNYSSRSAAAAYCVADQSTDAFRRFHAILFAKQPAETAASLPDDTELIETARVAGVADASDCISKGKYLPLVKGLAKATNIVAVPTIRINGANYEWSTPEDLISRIKTIEGALP